MKILITGGAGFIGSNFIRHVRSLGDSYTVVNFDELTYAGNLANLQSVAGNPRTPTEIAHCEHRGVLVKPKP